MEQASQEKRLMTEIIKYGKYALEMEMKREESLIAQANQMATAFSFSTAALYILFQIGLEYYPSLSSTFLVIAIAPITYFLLLSLLFAFLASWRWNQGSFHTAGDFFNYVMQHEKQFIEEDYAFLTEWKAALTEKHSRIYTLNNRRGVFIRISMWLFIVVLVLVFIFGTIALLKIGGII